MRTNSFFTINPLPLIHYEASFYNLILLTWWTLWFNVVVRFVSDISVMALLYLLSINMIVTIVIIGYAMSSMNITVTSLWARWSLKSPASRLFTQPFVQAQIKESIKAPRHWPLWGELPTQITNNAENVSIWWRHHEQFPPSLLGWGTAV